MNIEDYLIQGKKLFLDTAPVIYYVENHPQYQSLVNFLDSLNNSKKII